MKLFLLVLLVAVGTYAIWKFGMWSKRTGRPDGNIAALIVALVMLYGAKIAAETPEPVKQPVKQTQVAARNISVEPRPTSEAELQKQANEESERKARDEQYIAREQELAANRMPVDEFHARFLATLNVEKMSSPTKRTMNGVVETVTYPLDYSGEVSLMEVSSFGTIKTVIVSASKIGNGNLDATWLMYAAAVQAFVSLEDMDYIFAQLQMWPPETMVADLKNSRSVTVGNYRFQKNAGSNSISFSIVDIR